jgi:DNA-binding NarL/FixJ family response regulator
MGNDSGSDLQRGRVTLNSPKLDQENIFTPRGMSSTQIPNDHTQVIPQRATGYRYDDEKKSFGVEFDTQSGVPSSAFLTVDRVTMPSMNGLEAAQILKHEFPSMDIIIVSQHDSRGFQWAALPAGVNGYVVKSNAAKDLIPELRKIQRTHLSA